MSIPPEQAETAALLAAVSGAVARETHISAVFVGRTVVLKLRKAVRLSFVDFTPLAERERTARREFELNAPHAPGLYRAVLAVVRRANGALALSGANGALALSGANGALALSGANGALALSGANGALALSGADGALAVDGADSALAVDGADGALPAGGAEGTGPVVDWVVAMAPVPDADFLDVRAEAGAIDMALLDAMADAVVAYHAALPAAARDQHAALRAIADGNAQSARAAGLAEAKIAAWHAAERAALEACAGWLRARAAAGFVRRAHGDLHLGNFCLWHGRPVAFDALEFDEDLATIDLAYDLAFLLMDLDHRLGRPAANRVLARYVARTGDHGLIAGLPAFLSMRAFIRGHVEATRGHDDAARAYLSAARAALAPAPPVLVAIGGLPGTGKSTLARALAPSLGRAPGALILRSDEVRKRRHGVAPEQPLPVSAYDEAESRHVLADLVAAAAATVASGHAVVADATFMDPRDRAAITRAAGGAPFVGIWLHAPLATLEARVAARRGDASDATVDVLRRAARADPGPGPWLAVDARDTDSAIRAIREAVGAAVAAC